MLRLPPFNHDDDLVWKTGQRVPFSGRWVDQHGVVTRHEAHRTFPECLGRKGECAWRRYLGH